MKGAPGDAIMLITIRVQWLQVRNAQSIKLPTPLFLGRGEEGWEWMDMACATSRVVSYQATQ
jgi:hypothetical protein